MNLTVQALLVIPTLDFTVYHTIALVEQHIERVSIAPDRASHALLRQVELRQEADTSYTK